MNFSTTARLLLASALSLSTLALAAPNSAKPLPTPKTGGENRAAPTVECERGTSGAVNACLATTGQTVVFPGAKLAKQTLRWVPVMTPGEPSAASTSDDGETVSAPERVGIFRLERQAGASWERVGPDVITRVYFAGGKKLNGYAIGRHPGEGRAGKYTPPRYFIEVTEENQDYPISPTLRLGQFLTKNQGSVWPKYVPLEVKLVDKLERVAEELRKEGFSARKLHVMSGYRTPQYNGPGGKGRAKFSRHTYGDAADVWVDDDGDGVMDDLNRDGRLDRMDAEYLAELARRVEEQSPSLVGGAGTYRANSAHGPFTHIDVRGHAASWTRR